MELIVVEGPITDEATVLNLDEHTYERIAVSVGEVRDKNAGEIYEEWLSEDPSRERIENPIFFIARQVSLPIDAVETRKISTAQEKKEED